VHPLLVQVIKRALEISDTPFIVTDGVRTTAQQQALYAKGRTQPGAIVTQCDGIKNKSPHQIKSDGFGYAVDLYPDINKDGVVQSNEISSAAIPYLKAIAKAVKQAARQLGAIISWGGDWTSFKDYPHFELKGASPSVPTAKKIVPVIVLAALVAVSLAGCATKKKVLTNENSIIENYDNNKAHTVRDSIYINITDSIYTDRRGDTVFITKKVKQIFYKEKIVKDTVRLTDTIFIEKNTVSDKPPDKAEKFFNLTGKISFGIIIAGIIYLFFRIKKFVRGSKGNID
jgi:peptidoglycan L-alanyl-D-glutamate endopeptidase CwlK